MKNRCAASAVVILLACLAIFYKFSERTVLRIYDYETGQIYAEVPAKEGDELFFGWIHSLEKIPWHEYYHIAQDGSLILDEIAFPAFGAGIPENKGTRVWIEDGMIHMGGIGQVFTEFTWINSNFATREIMLNGVEITRGGRLPDHKRVNLKIFRTHF